MKCYSIASMLLLLGVWHTSGALLEKTYPIKEPQVQTSPAIIKTDSTTSINWDLAEDILMQYVNSVERHLADSCITETFYDTIVSYYMLNNPADGALGEILSNTTYLLFDKSDSLCLSLDKFMQTKQISSYLCDTIWYRIACKIQCYLKTEEDEINTDDVKTNNILFLKNRGYWLNDIEKYLPYTSGAR